MNVRSHINPSVKTFREWLSHNDVVGLDIETDGLERKSIINCVQVANGTDAYIITERITRMLWEVFVSPVNRVAIHNTTFDLREILFLVDEEYPECIAEEIRAGAFAKIEDTMVMSQVLFGGILYQFNLTSMIKRHCPGLAYGDEAMVRLWQRVTNSEKIPTANTLGPFKATITPEMWSTDEDAITYACCDAVATWTLWHIFNELSSGTGTDRIMEVERELLPTVMQLNMSAMPVHPGRLTAVIQKLKDDIEKKEDKSLARFGVLVSHPTRLQELANAAVAEDPELEECLGRTPTGKLKCDSDSLEAAAEHGWPVAKLAASLKKLKKRLQLMQSFEDFSYVYGNRLMLPATYKPCGAAATGRWSASDPPMQQVPRDAEYRRVVKAKKGWKLVVADYSTMEPRVAAKLSRDGEMRKAILEGDLYNTAARNIDGKKKVKPERRQQLKNFFMAYLFGAGGKTLALQANMTIPEALATRNSLDMMFPEFARWRKEMVDSGPDYSVDGYPMDTGSGGEYKRVAWSVQGHASYLMKRALNRFKRKYPEYHIYLVCTMHDEAMLHLPEKKAEAAAHALSKCMLYEEWIIMPAEAKVVDDWGQAK